MSNLNIRLYNSNDENEVIKLWLKSTKIAHNFMTEEFLQNEEKNMRNMYLPNCETHVAELNDNLVGFISMIYGSDVPEIGGLFVSVDNHRTGVGSKLLAHIVLKNPTLDVEVFQDNTNGVSFYKKNGFCQTKIYTHESTQRDVLRMQVKQVG